jgi:hypothetical protein
MNIIKKIYFFYFEGFQNMTVGKTLWKFIALKLLVILVFLKLFVHDKTFKSEYVSIEAKSDFVSANLIKGKSND